MYFPLWRKRESREASTVLMSSPDTPQLLHKCLSFLSMGVWVEIISVVGLGPEISWRGKVSSGMDCHTVLLPLPNKLCHTLLKHWILARPLSWMVPACEQWHLLESTGLGKEVLKKGTSKTWRTPGPFSHWEALEEPLKGLQLQSKDIFHQGNQCWPRGGSLKHSRSVSTSM